MSREQLVPDGHRPLRLRPGEGQGAARRRPAGPRSTATSRSRGSPTTTRPQVANVLAAVQAMLAQVGINVVPRAVDTPTYNGIVFAARTTTSSRWSTPALQNGPDPGHAQRRPQRSRRSRRPATTSCASTCRRSPRRSTPRWPRPTPPQRDARYQDVCKAMNANLPWAHDVGGEPLRRRLDRASTDFVWTPAPAGGPFDVASREVGDRRSRLTSDACRGRRRRSAARFRAGPPEGRDAMLPLHPARRAC